MLRGYRFLLVAVGLVLAANHAHAKSTEQPPARQNTETSLEHIAARYDDSAKRAESADQQEAPCGPKQYGSNADLCAQWKAADAATDSAWWAWLGGLVGIGSLVGVFVALVIARQSNGIARDTAKKQLRAYLDFNGVTLNSMGVGKVPSATSIELALAIKNYGQTPASKMTIARRFYIQVGSGDWVALLPDDVASSIEFSSIAPNDGGTFNSAFDIPNKVLDAVWAKTATFKVLVEIKYFDIFNKEQQLDSAFVSQGNDKRFVVVEGTRHTT